MTVRCSKIHGASHTIGEGGNLYTRSCEFGSRSPCTKIHRRMVADHNRAKARLLVLGSHPPTYQQR